MYFSPMKHTTQRLARVFALALSVALLLALLASGALAQESAARANTGAVYVMTNDAAANAVQVFNRADDGTLTLSGTFPTGGAGTGSGLGSQGALILSPNGRLLFAVNAGSDEITAFQVRGGGLVWVDTEPSNGDMPISLTYHGGRLVALNAGGSGAIAAFRVSSSGQLAPIPGATQPLSNGGVGPAPGPAQVSFTPDGRQLVVTEKATNLILTYVAGGNSIQPPVTHPSSGETPFGFAFAGRSTLIVSEAFGGAPDASAMSSYHVGKNALNVVTPSAPTTETAACWVVVTGDGKYTYTTNTGSGSVTGYAIGDDGSLTILDADGVTGPGSTPIDEALSRDSRYLYVLNSGTDTVSAFAVEWDGSLTPLGEVPVAATSVGIAAW
jgi:6-phosphogluconolactonase (cycloisomerase 2 family)